MPPAEDTFFARLVSLACHDLRTPLATVHGFARTLVQREEAEPMARYLRIMGESTDQLADLIDELQLAARIEAGRFEPELEAVDSLELARAAAERLGDERAGALGSGVAVRVEREATERALSNLALCAVRHGGVERVDLRVDGARIALTPVTPEAAPVVVAEQLRDLGAAVARRLIEALGGSVAVQGEMVVIDLPAA